MLATGLRPRAGEGAHRIVLLYARYVLGNVITDDDLTDATISAATGVSLSTGDYPSTQFSAEHVNASADVGRTDSQGGRLGAIRLATRKRS